MNDQVWTVKDVIAWSNNYLREAGSTTPRLDAEVLLAHTLQCRRLDLYLDHHKPLISEERKIYRELIKRRSRGEPIAYILSFKEFYGLRFELNSHTLIPRPDTEILVETALEAMSPQESLVGLDVGTGSGCIAITLKRHRPLYKIFAWDICAQALSMARHNANTLDAEIEFLEKDARLSDSWTAFEGSLDFVISNPPYIGLEEVDHIHQSVKNFEPHRALFAEKSGLSFYEIFADSALIALKPGGKIFLEVGYLQADAVSSLLVERHWCDLSIHKDLGGHNRVVTAKKPASREHTLDGDKKR